MRELLLTQETVPVEQNNEPTARAFGRTAFEGLATVIEISEPQTDQDPHAGPTSRPTHLGGQFVGIDQDYD